MSFITTNDDAMGNSNFKRNELDYYPTPKWVTVAVMDTLLKHNHINHNYSIWEPACGEGHMVKVLEEYPNQVFYSDIKDYGYGRDFIIGNFLLDQGKNGESSFLNKTFTSIITNPPYGDDAEKFIKKALDISGRTIGVSAFLLRNEYDCSKGRAHLFNQYPFARKLVLTSRPRWIEGSTGAPRHNYAWYIWDYKYINKSPVIEYYIKPKDQT